MRANPPAPFHDGHAWFEAIQNPKSKIENSRSAFTLIELLVVISILGILFYLSLPALKDMSKSDAMGAANRQIMDDIARARRLAINHRTIVFMLFMSSNIISEPFPGYATNLVSRLLNSQYSGYALFTRRRVGEQPGRESPAYLMDWKVLPKGIMIPPWKYTTDTPDVPRFRTNTFPFPPWTNYPPGGPSATLPYIAFNYQGSLVKLDATGQAVVTQEDEIIPLARGSLFFPEDLESHEWLFAAPDLREIPPGNSTNNYNHIRIDWLTGRTKVERPEFR